MADDFETFRDPLLSLYQSAVTAVARQLDSATTARSRTLHQRGGLTRSALATLPGVAADIARREYASNQGVLPQADEPDFAPRELSKADTVRVCAELAFQYMQAHVRGDAAAIARLDGEFQTSVCDPVWTTTVTEHLRYFGASGTRREIPYVRPSAIGARTIEIPAQCRIALAADWGTGAAPAITLLRQIEKMSPAVFVHLGDIYYSGTPDECATAFTSIVTSVLRADAKDTPIFTLSGNHDMYCGGIGYYDLIRTLNKKPATQDASFFCLRSADEKWQLLAMDTGLHDHAPLSVADAVTHLEEEELEWHCARIREFSGKTILLSHHQLFSAFSPIGARDHHGQRNPLNPHLAKAFKALQSAGNIAAWFWGHEHTLAIYQPFADLVRGRCIGHGAVPVSIRDKIYDALPDLTDVPTIISGTELKHQGGIYAHGFAMLELGTDTAEASYYQLLGSGVDLIFSESLV